MSVTCYAKLANCFLLTGKKKRHVRPAKWKIPARSGTKIKVLLMALLFIAFGSNAQTVINLTGAATDTWTAPATGGPFYVRITARGGDGGLGNDGLKAIPAGMGAQLSGTFTVGAGQTIRAISSAKGDPTLITGGGGGGAGSGAVLVNTNTILLLAAGGSGGNPYGAGGSGAVLYSDDGNGGGTCCVNKGGGGGGVNSAGQSSPDGGSGGGQVKLDGFLYGGAPGPTSGGKGAPGMGGGGGEAGGGGWTNGRRCPLRIIASLLAGRRHLPKQHAVQHHTYAQRRLCKSGTIAYDNLLPRCRWRRLRQFGQRHLKLALQLLTRRLSA